MAKKRKKRSLFKKIFMIIGIIIEEILIFILQILNKIRLFIKKRPIKNSIITLIIITLISTLFFGINFLNSINNATKDLYDPLTYEFSKFRDGEPDFNDSFSILLIGSDSSSKRQNEDSGNLSRADALIYSTVNLKNQNVTLTSIPRDTLTEIECMDEINEKYYPDNPHYSYNAINRSYYIDATCTAESVENLLQLPVDSYISIDFEGLIWIVDYLGGITIDNEFEIIEQDSSDNADAIVIPAGEDIELTGEEALAYARHRKSDNDIYRGHRQKQIISEIFEKIKEKNMLTTLPQLIEDADSYVNTNLKISNFSIGDNNFSKLGNLTVNEINIEGEDIIIDGGYYYQFYDASLKEKTKEIDENLNNFNQSQDSFD